VLPLSYVLPLKAPTAAPAELVAYVRRLADGVDDVLVVDGSAPDVFGANGTAFGSEVRHVPVDLSRRCANGKVAGVLTGLDLAKNDLAVLGDDDVRWTPDQLIDAIRMLETYDLVAPANYYQPTSLLATYDTARQLLHRALGRDFPGTFALRRGIVIDIGGYDGDVLFENLELVRTVEARGGSVYWPLHLLVVRRPCSHRHFLGQRVRQAYDEFARPAHLIASLAVLPGFAALAARRQWVALSAAALGVIGWAELGRGRGGGRAVFPALASLLAPLWVLERGSCMWLALGWRLRGGVPYAGARVRVAAHSTPSLRRDLGQRNLVTTVDEA
jgi:Glycosyl transferase family 21